MSIEVVRGETKTSERLTLKSPSFKVGLSIHHTNDHMTECTVAIFNPTGNDQTPLMQIKGSYLNDLIEILERAIDEIRDRGDINA